MVLITVDFHAADDFEHLAIDAHVEVALAAHGLEELAVVSLTTLDQWGKDKDAVAGIVVKNHVEYLLFSVFHHLLASGVAVCTACTGKEQTHVVIDLCRSTHGGAGILVGGLLLNADDGREPRNLVDIGSLHTTEEIAGIGREGLDITALSLGEDSVEGQR